MKKVQKLVIIGIISCLWLLSTPLTTYGEEAKKPLVTDLSFDKESRILSGKTLPDVNISLADIVGSIPVAADGSFEIEVPEGIDQTTIAFADFINDQSTDIDYDFVIGDSYDPTAASSVKDTSANHLATSSTKSSQVAPGDSSTEQLATSSEVTARTNQLATPMLLSIIALIILIILTILTLVLFSRKKAKAAKELAELEASRSGRRKKKRRKKKSN